MNAVRGWINVDGSWNAALVKVPLVKWALGRVGIISAAQAAVAWPRDILIHDVRKPLPFGSGTLSAIYASHLLEHLYLEEGGRLLHECSRVLEAGGVIRLVVPDLKSIVKEYLGLSQIGDSLNTPPGARAADRMNVRLRFRESAPRRGAMLLRLYSALTDFHSHKWMYDAESLIAHVKAAGFTEVAEMNFRASRIRGIEEIESADRVLKGEGLCVEGVKP